MGLDMYLNKVKKEEIAYWRKANAIHDWFSRLYAKNHDGNELDNCQSVYVSKEDLLKLKEDCKKVLESSELEYASVPVKMYNFSTNDYDTVMRPTKILKDASVAKELLPTKSGFFFGNTSYDEWYVKELQNTVDQIDKILSETDFEEYSLEYYAWW